MDYYDIHQRIQKLMHRNSEKLLEIEAKKADLRQSANKVLDRLNELEEKIRTSLASKK